MFGCQVQPLAMRLCALLLVTDVSIYSPEQACWGKHVAVVRGCMYSSGVAGQF